ncbi:MAG: hypothetical protein Hyperionvirus8_14 [Hyperionvirus sp.]|uniref:Uncharacterized protein n=1 Tax=Hyperionvirus sp. TaxID=2487770 RepID=A0A3G5A8B0_9VIRU|nr:MAG: hypothetical protein Hyperionvirus8_14 [Hyperionvirus sp.]
MTTNIHFIAVFTPNKGGDSPSQVKEQYNFKIEASQYENEKTPPYAQLDQHIKSLKEDQKITLITEDINIPTQTINTYRSDNTLTLYISNYPTYIDNNVIYIGIDKDIIPDEQMEKLDNSLATYFTIEKVKQLSMAKILKTLKGIHSKIHLIVDLQIFDPSIAPSVSRSKDQKKFFSFDEIDKIISHFKNIYYLEVLGFNDSLDDTTFRYSKITGELCRTIIQNTFQIDEKRMNIFTEDSRFLIYRPSEQLTDNDIGWYIVKFLTMKERSTYLEHLTDKVITLPINDKELGYDMEVLITSTTIREQNEKSFYAATNILDYCLFPPEKVSMVFELLKPKVTAKTTTQ